MSEARLAQLEHMEEIGRQLERRRIRDEVKKKKLPIPNPYGTSVSLTMFNSIIDDILSIINNK